MKVYAAGKPLLSTTDWPSTVSCVVFFAGCNLRCRFCFNTPILEFDDKYLFSTEGITTELDKQKYLIEGVIVTGGEPTLQPEPL
ncbi:MAG: 4Fe-4S cluster-binding domain-containing protein, partial [Promethearchaeota archaeon]